MYHNKQKILYLSCLVVSQQKRKVRSPNGEAQGVDDSPAAKARERIVRRAAWELKDGMFINLGIGIPMMALNYIPDDVKVVLHSENGVLGLVSVCAVDAKLMILKHKVFHAHYLRFLIFKFVKIIHAKLDFLYLFIFTS